MPIQDLAGNLFIAQTSPMIGFAQADLASQLALRMYPFLPENIREADQKDGAQFVERFLNGPQGVWNGIDSGIRSLPDMWSITKCEDRFLPYLKWIVGWTSELDNITDDLDAATLRRLIATSVPFWKIRGTEDALIEILRLTTAARVRVWTWFDLRFILGETGMSEEHQGHDPWLLSLPGPPDYDENRMNVRIVDDGKLNRRLVRNLVKLTRPGGERITISYIAFLDLFVIDDDDSQWTLSVGSTSPTVAGGIMTVTTTQSVYVSVNGADDWNNYVCSIRFRAHSAAVFEAYRTGDGDCYKFTVDCVNSTVQIAVLLAGVATVITTVSTRTLYGWILDPTLFYTLRIVLVPEGATNRIRCWLDGNFIASVTNAAHSQGSIAIAGSLSSGITEVDEVEVFFNPLAQDVIDINA